MMDSRITKFAIYLLLFAAGYSLRGWLHTYPTPAPEIVTKVEYQDRVQTEIAYVPKETIIYKDGNKEQEKTDIDMTINKPELNIKVNGQDFTFTKSEDERYIFDKNKLQFSHSSNAALNISVPTIDKTKRWEIGVGISKDGPVGLVGFPIHGNYIGGWVAGGSGNVMAGVNIKI